MFQRDYIMRMIEQFTNVLATVMRLKSSKKYEETQQVLNEALYEFTGLSDETIERLSYRNLIQLVSGVKEVNPEKCFMLAELLKEKADVYKNLDDMTKALNLYVKSFNIYVEVLLIDSGSYLQPNHETVNQLIQILSQYELTFETRKLLFQYFEQVGKYEKAEDEFFRLLDQGDHRKVLLAEGIDFYERLQRKSPEELVKGNLPIDEVVEGLEKLRYKAKELLINEH